MLQRSGLIFLVMGHPETGDEVFSRINAKVIQDEPEGLAQPVDHGGTIGLRLLGQQAAQSLALGFGPCDLAVAVADGRSVIPLRVGVHALPPSGSSPGNGSGPGDCAP